MKRQLQSFGLLCALVLLLSAGIAVQAQQNTPSTRPGDPTAQQATPPQAQTPDQSRPAPDAQAQPSSTEGAEGQTFTGTIVKSGDKYKFQDTASGNTYDIDHQDQVKQFEGKKVRVHGTLDESAKMIHVQ
jgi:uncharacterized protein YdeI (BOF family)